MVRRLLSLLALSLGVIGFPSASFALIEPWCNGQGVTCTGSGPNVVGNSGSGLSHPEIVPIFWSSSTYAWTPATQAPILASLQYMVNGPYLSQLNQYGGSAGNAVGPARMTPIAPIYAGTMPPLLSASATQGAINAMITAGLVPQPGADLDMLYVVFVPPTEAAPFQGDNFGGSTGTVPYNAAWVVGNNPAALSHELVESIAGNMAVTNCTYTGTTNAANQIADICSCEVDESQQVPLAAYWSALDGECVVPRAYGNIYQYSSGTSWTQISGPVRQVYAGQTGSGLCLVPPCLIATDTNDNLIEYNNTPNSWSSLGVEGAMFSLGGGQILRMSTDGTEVYLYNGSSWSPIYSYPTSVTSGAFHLITDHTGSPNQYLPSSNTVVNIGGPGDQFVVGSYFAAALGFDHNYVAIYPPAYPGSWWNAGGSGAELFIGGGQALAVRDIDSSRSISAMTTTCTGSSCVFNPWKDGIGGSGYNFAIWGGNTPSTTWLAGLVPGRNAVFQDENPIESSSTNWQYIGNGGAKLVGQGAFLYVVSGILY